MLIAALTKGITLEKKSVHCITIKGSLLKKNQKGKGGDTGFSTHVTLESHGNASRPLICISSPSLVFFSPVLSPSGRYMSLMFFVFLSLRPYIIT